MSLDPERDPYLFLRIHLLHSQSRTSRTTLAAAPPSPSIWLFLSISSPTLTHLSRLPSDQVRLGTRPLSHTRSLTLLPPCSPLRLRLYFARHPLAHTLTAHTQPSPCLSPSDATRPLLRPHCLSSKRWTMLSSHAPLDACHTNANEHKRNFDSEFEDFRKVIRNSEPCRLLCRCMHAQSRFDSQLPEFFKTA